MCTVSENGEFMSFQDLKAKYGLEKTRIFFRYMQLRDYFTREIRLESDETSNNVIGVIVDGYKQKGPRVISAFYQALERSGGEGNNALHKSKMGSRVTDSNNRGRMVSNVWTIYIHKLTTMGGVLLEEFNPLFHNTQNKKQATCYTTALLEAVWEQAG